MIVLLLTLAMVMIMYEKTRSFGQYYLLMGSAVLLLMVYAALAVGRHIQIERTKTNGKELSLINNHDSLPSIGNMIERAIITTASVGRIHFESVINDSFPDGRSSITTRDGDYIADEGVYTKVSGDAGSIESLSLKSGYYTKDINVWTRIELSNNWTSLLELTHGVTGSEDVTLPIWGPIDVKQYAFTQEKESSSVDDDSLVFTGVPSGPNALSALTKSKLKLWVERETGYIVRLYKVNEFGPPVNKKTETTMMYSRFDDPTIILPNP